MLGRLIQLLWLLVLIPLHVMAEDDVIVQKRISVEKPLVLRGEVTPKIAGLKAAFDSENGRFFLMDSTKVYSFDVETATWEIFATIDPEVVKFKMDYSYYHNGLLFWDQGVGRVFLMDSTRTLTRLDKSFNHQNQFGHVGWVDPLKGTIFAFGGYGLFKLKSLLTRYNPSKQEWNESHVSNPHQWPAPQLGPSVFPDTKNGKIYFLGLKMSHADYYTKDFPVEEKELKAFWVYDLNLNNWTRLTELPKDFDIKTEIYKDVNLTNYSVHPDLSFLLFSRENNFAIVPSKGLIAFDFESKSFKKITEIQPEFNDLEAYLSVHWSALDEVFYVLSFEYNHTQKSVVIHPYSIEIKDETAFLDRLRYEDGAQFFNVSILIAMLLVSIPFGAWVMYKYRTHRTRKQDQCEPQHDKIVVKLDQMDNMEVSYLDKPMDKLPEGEWLLLKMLSLSSIEKGVYLVSDDIEKALLPSHPSQDYARRFRNLTMDRLIGYLTTFTGDSSREFILKRPTLLDKRKFEYRLNDACFVVESGK
jgi:hypothetical protein